MSGTRRITTVRPQFINRDCFFLSMTTDEAGGIREPAGNSSRSKGSGNTPNDRYRGLNCVAMASSLSSSYCECLDGSGGALSALKWEIDDPAGTQTSNRGQVASTGRGRRFRRAHGGRSPATESRPCLRENPSIVGLLLLRWLNVTFRVYCLRVGRPKC